MANAARNHRDNVFCILYSDRKNLLSLYNAVNGTDYRSQIPRSKLTGHQSCSAEELRGI